VSAGALGTIVARVAELSASYSPPDFAHVPDPDAAIFLCAVDHKTGYERAHDVGGRGSLTGSELMWEVALAAGHELRAEALLEVRGDEIAELFRVDDETVGDPGRRAGLWRDLARGLVAGYRGETKIGRAHV